MQIDIKLAICASFVQIALKTDQKNVLTKISVFVYITIDFAAKCRTCTLARMPENTSACLRH
jgi:hypothetical protein